MIRFGYKPSPAHAPKLGGSPLSLISMLPQASMLPNLGDVYDQLSTSTCVSQASAKCIEIATGKRVSRLAINSAAHIQGGESLIELTDDGVMPSDAVAAMANVGVCLEERWPFDETRVLEPAPWDVIQADVRVTGWARLSTRDDVKAHIASGRAVMCGGPVDQAYMDYRSGVYQGMSGPSLGGHMQTIVAYNGMAWRLMNSWGTSFGEQGFAWVAESWLFGGQVSDFYALEAT